MAKHYKIIPPDGSYQEPEIAPIIPPSGNTVGNGIGIVVPPDGSYKEPIVAQVTPPSSGLVGVPNIPILSQTETISGVPSIPSVNNNEGINEPEYTLPELPDLGNLGIGDSLGLKFPNMALKDLSVQDLSFVIGASRDTAFGSKGAFLSLYYKNRDLFRRITGLLKSTKDGHMEAALPTDDGGDPNVLTIGDFEVLKMNVKASEDYVKDVVDTQLAKALKEANPLLWISFTASYSNYSSVIVVPYLLEELNYNSEPTLSPIQILGRPLRKYHYTGGEDTLEFKLLHKLTIGRTVALDNRSTQNLIPIEKARIIASFSKPNSAGEIPIVTLSYHPKTNVVPNTFMFNETTKYLISKVTIKPRTFLPRDISEQVKDRLSAMFNTWNYDGISELLGTMPINPHPYYIEQSITLKCISNPSLQS